MPKTNSSPLAIRVVDSHTGGEPTRVVLSGGPDLGVGPLADRVGRFRECFDEYRSAIVNEPRGSDVLVGALLCKPEDHSCATGVIFFNNVGYLGMCGHGTIGLVVTLAHLGRITPGEHRIETPVGVVTATLNEDGSVSVGNVHSHRKRKSVAISIDAPDGESGARKDVVGDVAYGGNWFYLVKTHGLQLSPDNIEQLTSVSWAIRRAINAAGYGEVDHVELLSSRSDGVSRNFVLCPGGAYDRSPCGTGTSAKLACLAADGELQEGEPHVIESIIGSRFVGTFRWVDQERGLIAPTITGTAHVTAEATLLIDERDLYAWGIRDQQNREP
jgi:4-hydroxyproline epimerase